LTESLHRRVRQMRQRALVRAWEYRQRAYAKGTWYRLRRVLADARFAYAISDEDARQLVAEGFTPEPVGAELEPGKTIVFVPRERIDAIAAKTALRVALDAELLGARAIALVRFQ